ELAADAGGRLPGHTRDRLLPGRGVRARRVLVVLRPGPGQALTADTVFGEHEVEDRGHHPIADADDGDPAGDLVDLALGGGVEARQTDLGGPVRIDGAAVSGGRLGDGQGGVDVLECEGPLAVAVGGGAVGQGAGGVSDPTGALVPGGGLGLGVGGVGLGGYGAAYVGGGGVAAGPVAVVAVVF